jgi:hypothetical protein
VADPLAIHRDEPDCCCGRCEPAEGPGGTIGSLLSGNPACEYPACAIRGEGCRWAPSRCFEAVARG